VGIDGQTNATVEQAGTSDVCQDGVPLLAPASNELWGYRLGEKWRTVGFAPYVERPVRRRLSVAEVSFANGHWVFMVDDAHAGWHSSTPVAQPTPSLPLTIECRMDC